MTGSRSAAGRVPALLALTGVLPLSGALLLALAVPASAQISNPGSGAVYPADASVRIAASYGPSGQQERLLLTPPGGGAVVVASAGSGGLNGGTLEYLLDTRCWSAGAPAATCAGPRPAPNGTWTVSQSGGTTDSSTFALRVPPASPAGVVAAATSPTQATVSWQRGAEPDLTGYTVLEGASTVAETPVAECSAGSCSATVSYAAQGSGRHSYTVRARRSDGSGGSLTSGASAPASTTLTAPPTAASSPGPGASPAGSPQPGSSAAPQPGTSAAPGSPRPGATGSPASGGGSAPGSAPGSGGAPVTAGTDPSSSAATSATAQREAFAVGFSAFGPKLGIPKLPPLPSTEAPAVAPLPDGTYEPTLGFGDQVVREPVQRQNPVARAGSVVSSALDRDRLARSTAGALVLLLAGAHLRRWLASSTREQ